MFAFVPFDIQDAQSTNPSAEVANLFGIKSNQLPGVVLFTMLDTNDRTEDYVYYPLKPGLFEEDPKVVENVFADLFTEIEDANEPGLEPAALLIEVQRRVKSIQQSDRVRPTKQYFIELGQIVAGIPKDLLGHIGGAFAGATARQLTGG
jgi:hypothetical protein